ncbi:MAG: class I SAM-dependent methyltransferase [Bacteroidota bacterium]
MNYKKAVYDSYLSFHNKHLYGAPSLERFNAHKAVNDFYLNPFLPNNKQAAILDIGCGDGNLVYWLQQKGYQQAQGVDVSAEQIESGLGLGITNLFIGDLTGFLQNKENKYDLIIARDVFEHFTRQDFFEALIVIKKALSKNGKLVIQVPNGEGLHYTSIFFGDITHEMAYTMGSLRQLTMAAGFSQVKVFPVNPYPKGIKGFIRSILWKYKVLLTRFWQTVERGGSSGIFTANLIAQIE